MLSENANVVKRSPRGRRCSFTTRNALAWGNGRAGCALTAGEEG
jgi:hypothetical protein